MNQNIMQPFRLFVLGCLSLVCLLLSAQNLYAKESNSEKIKFKYLGAAGWEIISGTTTVLLDPYISRLKLDSKSSSKKDKRKIYKDKDYYQSDTAAIDKIIGKADFILVHHSHMDHLADVPYIAKKTGAKVIGTETSINILKAYNVPEKQLITVRGGEDYQFDNVSIRVIPSIHSALKAKHYFDSRIYTEPPELPLRIGGFIEGGSLMFLIRFDSHKVLTAGSMNFLEREVVGLKPDILLPGVNFSRLEIHKYTERLLKATNYPKIILPTHWDNFRVPYGYSQKEAIEKKIKPFIEEVKAASPESKVITPIHLETIEIQK